MRKYGKWILTVAAISWCIVIWQFSLAPATDSAVTSSGVREFLNQTLRRLGLSFELTPTMVRKTAHFAEFFLLGVLGLSALRAHALPHSFPLAVCGVFGVAAVDECIQIFVPGRGPALLDVLLDTLGGTCGALLLWGGARLLFHFLQKRKENSEKIAKTP